jgi:hypothetical protein
MIDKHKVVRRPCWYQVLLSHLFSEPLWGGPLGGRFGFKYIKPLSIPDGATLLHQTLKYYAPGFVITPELALYASAQLGGHPYYLYCLAVSDCDNKGFEDEKAIDRVICYEIEDGKIYGFWMTHFRDNRKYINADDDEQLGKKLSVISLYEGIHNLFKAFGGSYSIPKFKNE